MYIAGFLIGFLGSLHCLGMCGPIAIAMHTRSGYKSVVYNMGRVISYASIGAIFGILGSGASLFGLQQQLSIVAGVVVLAIAFSPKLQSSRLLIPWQKYILRPLRKVLLAAVNKQSLPTFLFAGLLNGLLPCGLVYLAVSTAIASGSVFGSMITMIGFGLGTWPMMLAIGWGSTFLNRVYLNKLKYIVPVFAVLMGCVLIIRGLALDIPYLSPMLTFAGLGTDITVCQ